ncbi:MAG: E3 binding domain-containing protein, partial [Planctomycetia bacterium]|nr:E3 binding domain-containing protein [Planctomycetia bacterium]
MAIDFKVPDLGENVESGDIVSVLVKEGDEIQADQSVMEIETGKAVVELPCPFPGRITKVHVHKGSKVKVGDSLLTVEGAASLAATKAKAPVPAKAHAEMPDKPERIARTDKRVNADLQSAAQSLDQEEVGLEVAIAQKVQSPAARPKVATNAKPAAKVKLAHAAPAEPAPTEKPPAGKTPPAGPATRRLARELGVDLSLIVGTGPHGRITEK